MQHAPAKPGARLAEIAPVLMQQGRYAEADAALHAPVQHSVPVSDAVSFCALVPFLWRIAQLRKSGSPLFSCRLLSVSKRRSGAMARRVHSLAGECFFAIFTGPEAERRRREYGTGRTATILQSARPSSKFFSGIPCSRHISWVGQIRVFFFVSRCLTGPYEICLRQNAIYNNAVSSLARAWLEALKRDAGARHRSPYSDIHGSCSRRFRDSQRQKTLCCGSNQKTQDESTWKGGSRTTPSPGNAFWGSGQGPGMVQGGIMDDDGDLGRKLDGLMRSLEPFHGHSVARRWHVPSRFAGALILTLVLAVRGWGQPTDQPPGVDQTRGGSAPSGKPTQESRWKRTPNDDQPYVPLSLKQKAYLFGWRSIAPSAWIKSGVAAGEIVQKNRRCGFRCLSIMIPGRR